MAKSIDAADLKSAGTKLPYRFKSGHRHQKATEILSWYFRCFFVLVSTDSDENFLHGNSLWFCTVKQHSKHSALCKTGAAVRSSAPKTKIPLSWGFLFFLSVSTDSDENFLNGNSLWFCSVKQHGKHFALCKTGATCGSL